MSTLMLLLLLLGCLLLSRTSEVRTMAAAEGTATATKEAGQMREPSHHHR